MMEKQGVIDERTPGLKTDTGTKTAADARDQHLTTRAAACAADTCKCGKVQTPKK